MQRQLAAILAQPNRTRDLRRIAVPTLAVHGLDDPLVAPSGGLATRRRSGERPSSVTPAWDTIRRALADPQVVGAERCHVERDQPLGALTELGVLAARSRLVVRGHRPSQRPRWHADFCGELVPVSVLANRLVTGIHHTPRSPACPRGSPGSAVRRRATGPRRRVCRHDDRSGQRPGRTAPSR